MSVKRERLWRYHRYRGEYDFCPLCFEPIKWIYDCEEGKWSPCDAKPAAYIVSDEEPGTELYTRFKRRTRGVLYRPHDMRFTRQNTRYGYIPHVYTCAELKGQEKLWQASTK